MRKFTKEITALIASVAVSTAAGIGALPISSEEIVRTAGVDMIPDETICATEEYLPPTAGEPMPSDELIDPTNEKIPPLVGDPTLPDEWIETTEEEIPPLGGVPTMPDEWIETTELPPIMGDIAPADGDVNWDGQFNIADVVLLQKWLLKEPGVKLANWKAADLYTDGKLDVFDLMLIKKALIEKINDAPDKN